KLLDLAAIDDGANQLIEAHFPAMAPFGRRGQAEPVRGDGADGGELIAGARQVMAFIKDNEAVAIAPAFQVNVRGVVGRDGERLEIVIAAAEQTDPAPLAPGGRGDGSEGGERAK